jgi:hypothetical protein
VSLLPSKDGTKLRAARYLALVSVSWAIPDSGADIPVARFFFIGGPLSASKPRAPDPLACDRQLASAAVSAARLDSASSHSGRAYFIQPTEQDLCLRPPDCGSRDKFGKLNYERRQI